MSTELDKFLDYLENKPTTPTTDQPEEELVKPENSYVNTSPDKKTSTARSTPTGKTSLTALANDDEFATRASRFLEGIGSNENIFEYLRDSDYSLTSAIGRSFAVGDWTDEQKNDYLYLKTAFDNTDLSGFRERFGALKDISIDIVADPLNIVTALFAIPTGGASLAGRAALGTSAQAAMKKFTSSKLAKSAMFGAAEGAAWGGLHNYFLQDIDVDLGAKDDIDMTNIAASTILGGTFAGAIGGGTRYLRTRKSGEADAPDEFVGPEMPNEFRQKEFKFSNEDAIDNDYQGTSRQKIESDYELDTVTMEQHPDFVGPPNPLRFTDKYIEDDLTYKTNSFLNSFLSKTVGKATTQFLESAKKSELLQELLRDFRYDYDTTMTSKGKKGVKRDSYGLAVGRRTGKYMAILAKGLNRLDHVGWRNRIAKDQQDDINFLLRDRQLTVNQIDNLIGKNYKGVQITVDMASSYKHLRTMLDETYEDLAKAGLLKTGTLFKKGFLPRIFNYTALKENRGEFERLLIQAEHATPTNFVDDITIKTGDGEIVQGTKIDALGVDSEIFGIDFLKEAGVQLRDGNKFALLEDATARQLRLAKRLKAEKIVDDMLEYRWTPMEFRQKSLDATGFLQPRRFTNLDDNQIAKFLESDTQTILEDYFTSSARAIERSNFFGRTAKEFRTNKLQPILAELQESGFSREEATKITNELSKMHARVVGIETDASSILNQTKGLRFFSDWGKLSQQMAHLPFATLSSVTEPLILLSRADLIDSPRVIKDIASALVKEGASVVDRSIKGFQRGVLKQRTKGIKDIDDEAWGELYQTGLALEQAVQERLEGLAGEGLHSSAAKNIQAAFFKANLLTQWTRAVQLASFTTGKRLIRQNAQKLATGKTLLGRKLTKSNRTYLTEQLEDLGVNSSDAVAWYNSSLRNGKFDDNLSKGLDKNGNLLEKGMQGYGNDLFYKTQQVVGANRFTKEIILNPSVAEANRPLWFSTPSGQLLMQFAGYPTVFNNTILKKFSNEMVNSPMQAIPKVLPTVLLMTAVAHVGNTIRSSGANMKDYETGARKGDGELTYEAVRRWGGLGWFDYAARYGDENQRNVGDFTSLLKTFAGPLPQDAIDAILYRKGLAEIGVTNLPGYALYDVIGGEGTKKELRRLARGSTKKKEKSRNLDFAKGGIVTNVPNVHPEPDEVKMRGIDMTYNEMAGEILKDEEDV